MRARQLSLAVVLSSMIIGPAFSQTAPPPAPVPDADVVIESEDLPAPSVEVANELAFIVPKERAVTVNLAVDRPPIPRTSQFKLLRSGQVLAETSRGRPERLEFEVMIEGPVCDLPVYLPVCKSSIINAVYAEHGASNPELVVNELAELGVPDVSVVAIRQSKPTERHEEARLQWVDNFDVWTPYYRVAFRDAGVPPALVKVPLADCDLYRLADRTAANHLGEVDELVILTLSEGNWHPCHCHAKGFAQCHCGANPSRVRSDVAPPAIVPPAAGEGLEVDPTAPAPAPAAPTADDPFTADEA